MIFYDDDESILVHIIHEKEKQNAIKLIQRS